MFGSFLGGLAGDLIGGIMGNQAQTSANRTNIMLNRENREWQERMSNTAYQRATKDMLASGLNPMLAYSQGGADTPNNQAPTVEPVNALARSVSSAANKAMQIAQLKLTNAQGDIAAEQATQESIKTDAMKVDYQQTGDYYKRLSDQTETLKQQRLSATSKAQLDATEARVREIEEKLMQETFGANVKSAQERAQLLEREVGIADIRKILMNLDIAEKKAMSDWFTMVGEASPAAKAVMSIGQWLKMILGK